ncbi:YjiH family protein [Natronincola ferrireducens]|uniref:Nucleoside recognition GATE domain-containing membrane protein YjiH n=1 Tax=Natronincola ferrireducens TaxID=393762 RepID=A0A1G9FX42_9FIRM|nr:YjiH family protein [Natronincola ferrireducens]SDK92927.1 nucleoside recognition GATE domain-containing membrane protein YjiH [Natronincola ferrireducens]
MNGDIVNKKNSIKTVEVNSNSIMKFLIPSLFGIIMFLFPIPYEGAISTPVGILSEWLVGVLNPYLGYAVVIITTISAVMSIIGTVFKPAFIMNNKLLEDNFTPSKFYLIWRIVGAIFAILVLSETGTEVIYSGDTGGTMMFLMSTLIVWFFAASYLMPFLMNYGIMDYTGTVLRGFVKPLFKLPGRSAIDLVTSWIGNVNVGVVVTRTQYNAGYYTGREAATIATCFSAVSLPFCLVIAAMLGLDAMFVPFYLTIVVAGVLSAVIMSRIPPLSTLPDTYHPAVGKQIDEAEPEGVSKGQWALQKAVQKAYNAGDIQDQFKSGTDIFLGIIFSLVPIVMAWGTLALIIATYTPIFTWVSYPFGYYLHLLGVPEAFEAAPATVVGFADMFIPAILASGLTSVKTKFVIGVLSLVQIVYMTEVGTLLITSDIPVNFKHLLLIFIQKTVIALPIIVVMANILL